MTTTRNWDVIVAGAGPAGSVAARELSRRGVSVLLVEKAIFPRQKVCGCCLNEAALTTLDTIGLGHLTKKHGAIPLHSARLAAGRHSANLNLTGAALSREAFDEALRDAAVEAGATALHGVRATLGPIRDGDRAVMLHGDGEPREVTARVVVAANGLGGRLDPTDAAFDSIPLPDSRIGAGVIVDSKLVPDFYTSGCVFMATARGGYVGLVRLEDGRLDLGASFDASFIREQGGLAMAAATVLKSANWPIPTEMASFDWKGTPALTRRARSLAGPRWFAVGDAAGYVEPFTGEGMAWAIQSAVALAPLIEKAVDNWDEKFAAEWVATHARLLGRRQQLCRIVSRVLRSSWATGLAVRVLSAVPFLSRPIISGLNRPVLSIHGTSE